MTVDAANARQISEVPRWVFVRLTSCHVRPAPVTLLTEVVPVIRPAETNASRSWLPVVVVTAGLVIELLDVDRPKVTVASMMIAASAAVKFAVALAELTVTAWLAGVNVTPDLVGVTVYEPFSNPLKVKLPDASAVVVADAAPVRLTDALAPVAAGVIVPEIV